MKQKIYKAIGIFICIMVVLTLLALTLHKYSNSRTKQFTGEIIDSVDTEQKVVALTFDDGPSQNTEEILFMLDELDIKATFFLTGREIEENMDLTKAIVEAGHQIGNHSYSHQRMMLKTKSFIEKEIEDTNNLIREAGFEGDIVFRAPYCKKLITLPIYLKQNDIKHITFDVEPETYLSQDATPEEIAEYVLSNVEPGSIVLLHLMYDANVKSREALPLIVEGLIEEGYSIVTVNELLNINE